jgi:hypothetical protein
MALASFSALDRATALDHADADQSGPEQVEGKRFRNRRGGAVRVAAGQRQMQQVRLPTAAIREVISNDPDPWFGLTGKFTLLNRKPAPLLPPNRPTSRSSVIGRLGSSTRLPRTTGAFRRRRQRNLRPADRLVSVRELSESLESVSPGGLNSLTLL